MSDEYGNDIILMTDEDGNEVEMEHLDTIERDGETYMAFALANPSIEDFAELIILKVEQEGDEEILVTLEDADLMEELYGIFSDRLEEFYEMEELPRDESEENVN